MKITSVEKSKNKGIYLIYIDNCFAFSIRDCDAMKYGVYQDAEINEKELDFIKNQVLISFAKAEALNYISYKMRTKLEIEQKLKEKYPFEVIEEVLEYLMGNGYINDEVYAEKFIFEKKKLGKLSRKALFYKLLEKGISKEIIEEKLDRVGYNEKDYAKKFVKKVLIKEKKDFFKTENYLYSKGFSKDTIKSVIKEETNQDGD